MKILRYFLVVLLASIPFIIFAANPLVRPFGGRIITAPIPGANCPTSLEPMSPFIVIPVGINILGPFSSVPGPQTFGQNVPSAWILGNYTTIPIPDCFVGVPLLGQMPVFKAYMYGTSVPTPGLF